MAGFPTDPSKIEVGIGYGADIGTDPTAMTYTAVTSSVEPVVLIKRGRIGDAIVSQPTSIDMSVLDPGGVFSPRNITGTHYGQLRRNTPIRVRVDTGSGFVTRAQAYVPDWNPTWIGPNMGDRIAFQAQGMRSRLGQGDDAMSAMKRSLTKGTILGTSLIEYWPCEDPVGSTILASGLQNSAGTAPLANRATFGEVGPGGSSGAVRLVSGDSLSGPYADTRPAFDLNIPTQAAGQTVLAFSFQGSPLTETVGAPADAAIVGVECWLNFLGGTIGSVNIQFSETAAGASPLVSKLILVACTGINATGSIISFCDTSSSGIQLFDGAWHQGQVRMAQSGGNVTMSVYLDGALYGSTTLTTQTLGSPSRLKLLPDGFVQGSPSLTIVEYVVMRMSQIEVYNSTSVDPTILYNASQGYVGELATDRYDRLLSDEIGIWTSISLNSTEKMGVQQPGTLVAALQECEDADEGMAAEAIGGAPSFYPNASWYNQTVDLTLDYSHSQVTDLILHDDDRDLVNDVTVNRAGGASNQYELVTGPLGTDYGTGSGPYPQTPTRSLFLDEQAANHSHWLVMKGTVDEPRYEVTIDLRSQPGLIASWLNCDLASRIVVNNPPSIHTGPAPLDLVIVGYEELIDAVQWQVKMYCLPSRPFEVLQIATGSGNRSRIPATDGSTTVNVQRSATDTSFAVTSTTQRWIDSATYGAKFPFDVIVAGEVMSCTAITGTTLSQTMTMTRGKHGVSKVIPANSAVQLWRAPVLAL